MSASTTSRWRAETVYAVTARAMSTARMTVTPTSRADPRLG
ncbi:MAG: hypothetical protein ACREP9_22825 [Candidatus Dormibacteraceae bacterium]